MCAHKSALKNLSSLLLPSISSLNWSPKPNLKEALFMPRRMFSIIHLSKISVFQHHFPSVLWIRITLMLIQMRIWIRLITLMRILASKKGSNP